MATARGELLETQSAAEDEEDLLLMQQEAQQRHTMGSSAFSTSSVDAFLRDNGFQIDELGDDDADVLSSSADGDFRNSNSVVGAQQSPRSQSQSESLLEDDAAAVVEGLLRVDARPPSDDVLSSDDGSSHRGSAASAAAGEEDLPTPRFILLDDEDLLSVAEAQRPTPRREGSGVSSGATVEPPPSNSSAQSREWQLPVRNRASPRTPMLDMSFDRSLLLGGSGLSALSEDPQPHQDSGLVADGQTPRSPDATPTPDASSLRSGQGGSVLVGAVPQGQSVSRAPSSSSCSLSSSLLSRPSSTQSNGGSSSRRQDDELSDALGFRSSLSPQESPIKSYTQRTPPRVTRVTRPNGMDEEEEKSNQPGAEEQTGNPWSSPTDGRAEAQTQEWADVNVLLRKNGLPVVQLRNASIVSRPGELPHEMAIPDHESVISLVQEFVLQLDRKNETIQDLVIASSRTNSMQNKAEGDLASMEKKNDELRKALQSAQTEISRLQGEVKRQKDETDKQVKAVKSSCLKLQQQLKVSEHRVKAKEVLVERIQKKLQQQVDRENLNKTRDRMIFKHLQQREPRRANSKDTQSLDCISVYETQREQMQEEIDNLRLQVAALNGELRDKENTLSRRSSSSRVSVHWSDDGASDSHHHFGDQSDEMLLRIEAARREQEQAAAKLRQREMIMVKKISAIEEELLAAKETIAELKDENANLTLEAESRPSIRDYRLCQRRLHQLERQLSESKLALEEANDINELRRFMGTKDLIERDRLNHRLHLNRLNTLPKETLLEVVKEVCRVLNLTDITLITPSLHKLCNVVAAVPRMEKFIRDVCGFVYFSSGEEQNDRFELEHVLPTLQQWMVERKKLFELEGFKTAVVSELCKRAVEPSLLKKTENGDTMAALSSLPRAVGIIAELVELEKSVLHHREIYTQAAEELERQPSVLVNQIVRHFSHLFKVKAVEGVLPKINEVYLFVSEMENFLKSVRELLNLKPDASLPICVDTIRSLVEGGSTPTNQPHHDENADSVNYVVEKTTRGPVGPASGGVAGVRQVREMSILVRDLQRELGAATMQEILPRTRRLMELLSASLHQSPADDPYE